MQRSILTLNKYSFSFFRFGCLIVHLARCKVLISTVYLTLPYDPTKEYK